MYELFLAPFVEFGFMQRALVGCLIISLSAAPVGVFLVLRRMSLTGDAMSHAILPGAAIGFMISGLSVGAMTIGGLLAGCLVAVLAGITTRQTKTTEDSNLAAFYLISLALGVMIISMNGSSVDLLHVLFGSALGLNNAALILLAVVASITLLTLAVVFRPLVLECLDSRFLNAMSRRQSLFAYVILLILIVLNLVGGFHAMGTIMSVGLMVLPAVVARFWTDQLEPMIAIAMLMALVCCYTGLLVSYHLDVPTSPAIILSLGVAYLFSILFGHRNGVLTRLIRFRLGHLEH